VRFGSGIVLFSNNGGALMLCWDSDMPDDVARAYAIWDSVAAGNVSETARLLEMRRPTVQDWSQRYRWKERQANQRAEDRDRTISHAWARMAADLPNAVETVLAARTSVYDESGKPTPGTPTPMALKAALAHLAMFGITPLRTINATLTTATSTPTYTDDELDAMSVDELIALSLGKPLPPTLPPPQDFTSTQPGGREVTDPLLPDRVDAVSHAQGAAPIDADYSVSDAIESPKLNGDDSE
jgi:hypothetical protein